MKTRYLGPILVAVVAMLGPNVAGVLADEQGDDHDRARELYEHGEVHSLYDVLKSVEKRLDGDVVSIELVQTGDRWVYRFQVIDKDGRRSVVDVDAGSDTTLEHEPDEDD